MKVKLFTKSNPNAQRGMRDDELEFEINAWLAKNPTLEIVNVAQSCSARGETQELVISVWYKPAAELASVKLARNASEPKSSGPSSTEPANDAQDSGSTAP